MSHKKLRPFIVKVSVLGYFPLYVFVVWEITRIWSYLNRYNFKIRFMISINAKVKI